MSVGWAQTLAKASWTSSYSLQALAEPWHDAALWWLLWTTTKYIAHVGLQVWSRKLSGSSRRCSGATPTWRRPSAYYVTGSSFITDLWSAGRCRPPPPAPHRQQQHRPVLGRLSSTSSTTSAVMTSSSSCPHCCLLVPHPRHNSKNVQATKLGY